MPHQTGILLLNLGTPESPEPRDVGVYLREFLSDPWVIDIPAFFRWILVNILIVPRRAHASSLLYKKIWTKRGSPLQYHLDDLKNILQHLMGNRYLIVSGMRYGKPSIDSALDEFKSKGVDQIIVAPLYPQYSLAATQSSIEQVRRKITDRQWGVDVKFLPPFYAEPDYLGAVAEVSRKFLGDKNYDHYLFSFHGLPERQVKKTDATQTHCLVKENCCERIGPENRNCYRAQCYATARALADKLKIPKEKYEVCFQSRLGRTPWIKPHTDAFYRSLPAKGVKTLAVFSPSFVADCLETLEEIQIRGREEFLANGGEELVLVPSLNSDPTWAQSLSKLLLSF